MKTWSPPRRAPPWRSAKEILRQNKIEKLPIVDEDFRLKGLITIKDIEKAVQVSQLRP